MNRTDIRDPAYLYPSDDRPRVPPTENERFDPPTNYVNYGDADPETWGGLFLKWNGTEWTGVLVRPLEGYHEDYCTCQYDVAHVLLEPQDVWDRPDDPMTGWTRAMHAEIRSHNEGHLVPNVPDRLTYYVAGLVDNGYGWDRSEEHTVGEMCERRGPGHDPGDCEFETYGDLLASYGIGKYE